MAKKNYTMFLYFRRFLDYQCLFFLALLLTLLNGTIKQVAAQVPLNEVNQIQSELTCDWQDYPANNTREQQDTQVQGMIGLYLASKYLGK
ncbi:MAG: hypothetical protein SAJ37_05670 [Oscillatoria sp. PMC 1068.18]|nr:hypothetical protein [Oscillatoria sp. PMC 1076.18]MEC4988219.1 hypothetical protein [Oscillatoria sp. PMC 1068.18]